YLILVVDFSRASSAQDLRPNRMTFMIKTCVTFIRDFFNQNPLSQLGILVIRDGIAEKLTDLSGSPEAQIKRLLEYKQGASGDASLQNALDLSLMNLKSIPPYGHREVLVLFSSLTSCDPRNILASIQECKDERIRVSVVGVAAEVYVCKRMSEETRGTYHVGLGEQHLEELMLMHAPPPPAIASNTASELVLMGFPQRSGEDKLGQVHVGINNIIAPVSFTCPRCCAKVGELPCACHVCQLTLISSPHLARSYHHLFPVNAFKELSSKALAMIAREQLEKRALSGIQISSKMPTSSESLISCFGCLRDMSVAVPDFQQQQYAVTRVLGSSRVSIPMVLRCSTCMNVFCYDCDVYIHESLHNCPGCQIKTDSRAPHARQ
ncbi:hypothetical protein CEUSTIGMA_g13625.t1, partial [Chlamydomonas eustigma]